MRCQKGNPVKFYQNTTTTTSALLSWPPHTFISEFSFGSSFKQGTLSQIRFWLVSCDGNITFFHASSIREMLKIQSVIIS